MNNRIGAILWQRKMMDVDTKKNDPHGNCNICHAL